MFVWFGVPFFKQKVDGYIVTMNGCVIRHILQRDIPVPLNDNQEQAA